MALRSSSRVSVHQFHANRCHTRYIDLFDDEGRPYFKEETLLGQPPEKAPQYRVPGDTHCARVVERDSS